MALENSQDSLADAFNVPLPEPTSEEERRLTKNHKEKIKNLMMKKNQGHKLIFSEN